MLSADWAQAVDTVHSWDRMRWERNACDANWKRGTVIIAVVHFNWTITKTFSTHNTQHWIIRRREIKERSIHNFIINQVTSPFVDITFHFLFDIHGSSHKKNICQCGKTMRLFSLRKIQPSSDELNEHQLALIVCQPLNLPLQTFLNYWEISSIQKTNKKNDSKKVNNKRYLTFENMLNGKNIIEKKVESI